MMDVTAQVGIAPELLRSAARHGTAIVATAAVQKTATTPAITLNLMDSRLAAPDNVASFPLSALPAKLDAVVALTVSTGALTVTKTRRLVRVQLEPDQSAVVVDHHTRGLAVIKPGMAHARAAKPWLGAGSASADAFVLLHSPPSHNGGVFRSAQAVLPLLTVVGVSIGTLERGPQQIKSKKDLPGGLVHLFRVRVRRAEPCTGDRLGQRRQRPGRIRWTW